MAVKTIPAVGEIYLGDVPATRRLLHVSVGAATTSPDITVGDAAAYPIVTFGANTLIYAAWTQVTEAFTASVTVTLGDSDAADYFHASATIAPQSTGAVLVASTNSVPKLFAAAQDLEVVVGAATVAAGMLDIYIEYAILAD